MLKVLIISHVPWESTYGAGTSLRLHVKALDSDIIENNLEIDFIDPLSIKKAFRKARLWSRAKTPPFAAHDMFLLPTSKNYEGYASENKRIKNTIFNLIYWSLWIAGSVRLMFILRKKYDIVHLNSVVLAPTARLIKKNSQGRKPRVIMHVREFLKQPLTEKDKRYLLSVDQFICIDAPTKERLYRAIGADIFVHAKVIANPFTTSGRREFSELLDIGNRDGVKFCMIGSLSMVKGVSLVAQAFLDANLENCILFFVGEGEERSNLEFFANKTPETIKLLGTLNNVSENGIYNNIDVVLRGDPSFRTGRTVFEALYAGCIVVMPGTTDDLKRDEHLFQFQKQIVLFDPGSLASCSEALVQAACLVRASKSRPKPAKNNLAIYRKSILSLYAKVMADWGK